MLCSPARVGGPAAALARDATKAVEALERMG